MTEFETLVNPPQEVFETIANLASATEDWAFQMTDYNFWATNYDQFWFLTVVEKGTLNPVASVSLARWDSEDGPLFSIAMFYCLEKYRGQGHAKQIFQQIMDIVGDTNCTLTGALKMSDKYDKVYGFNKYPEYWNMYSALKCTDVVIPEKVSEKYTTKVWTDADFEALTAYDRTICTKDRKKHMKAWFERKDTFTRVVLDTSNKVVGYTTFRIVTKNRLSPAPFYADNLEAAEVLLKDMLNMIPHWQQYEKIGFLHPGCNTDVLKLLEKFAKGKEQVSTAKACRTQFTKELIPSPDMKVYALCDSAHQFV